MKKSRRRHPKSPPQAGPENLPDEIFESCQTIAMLADFLACGDASHVNAQTISRAGRLILLEAGKLQACYARLEKAKTAGGIRGRFAPGLDLE